MSKESRRMIGMTANVVNDLREGRITKGLFYADKHWIKIKGKGNIATVSNRFPHGRKEKVLTFGGKSYNGETPVSSMEY